MFRLQSIRLKLNISLFTVKTIKISEHVKLQMTSESAHFLQIQVWLL